MEVIGNLARGPRKGGWSIGEPRRGERVEVRARKHGLRRSATLPCGLETAGVARGAVDGLAVAQQMSVANWRRRESNPRPTVRKTGPYMLSRCSLRQTSVQQHTTV